MFKIFMEYENTTRPEIHYDYFDGYYWISVGASIAGCFVQLAVIIFLFNEFKKKTKLRSAYFCLLCYFYCLNLITQSIESVYNIQIISKNVQWLYRLTSVIVFYEKLFRGGLSLVLGAHGFTALATPTVHKKVSFLYLGQS